MESRVTQVTDHKRTEPAGTVRIDSVSKSFGDARVLDGVSLRLVPGRVHALLGHNGSGKSTLIKILAGVYTFDEGSVSRDGDVLKSGSPASSSELGLRFVHQRKNVIEQLSATDNVGIGGAYESVGPFVLWKRQRAKAVAAVQGIHSATTFDPDAPMGDGPEIVKTYLAIGRAIGQVETESVLVLDEPTASLSPEESEELLSAIKRLRNQGVAILYVSHRLREVGEIADDITILSDGKVILEGESKDVSLDDMIQALTPDGQAEIEQKAAEAAPVTGSTTAVTLKEQFVVDRLSSDLLNQVSFRIRPGEIVGVAGLDGSGREQVARALGGMNPDADVEKVTTSRGEASKLTPRVATQLGIALALESRTPGAVVDSMTVRENIVLRERSDGKRLGHKRSLQVAREWISELGILPRSPDAKLELMSGGNRQKVVMASALTMNPSALVVEDPTAGVDISSAVRIREVIVNYALTESVPVLWVSSDLEELETVSHRVLCIRDGLISSELVREEISERSILEAIS